MSINCLYNKNNKHNKHKKKNSDPLWTILVILFIIMLVVSVGTLGFRIFAKQKWIDSFVNGALVFTATTVVEPVTTYQGKVFSAIYNLISGIFVLILLGVILRGAYGMFEQEDECCVCTHCSNKCSNNCSDSCSDDDRSNNNSNDCSSE